MSIGYVLIIFAYILWGISGFIYGFSEIWSFGVLLTAVAITIGIRDYKLRNK